MIIKRLRIQHYRSHSAVDIAPSASLNCITGPNGVGKTNLLDAIHQLSLCKSHLSAIEAEVMQSGESFYRIQGDYSFDDNTLSLVVKHQPGKKKLVEYDGAAKTSLAEHIGKIPVVLISPDDVGILRESSDERRRFIDNALCQIDAYYLQQLMVYNKLLDRRNALLKSTSEGSDLESLLDVYDHQMEPAANYIWESRSSFIEGLSPVFSKIYATISADAEEVSCFYESKVVPDRWLELQKMARSKDIILQRTTHGIHKDEIGFRLQARPVKRFGSQGQMKTIVIALKLAQFDRLNLKHTPILLLDDIFDKLDTSRIQQLLSYLTHNDFGQVFLTDTDAERVRILAKRLNVPFKHFEISHDKAIEETQN